MLCDVQLGADAEEGAIAIHGGNVVLDEMMSEALSELAAILQRDPENMFP